MFKKYLNHTQEFYLLEEQDIIWKLVGPVLVRQDTDEAKDTVAKRLEYIQEEMYVCVVFMSPWCVVCLNIFFYFCIFL